MTEARLMKGPCKAIVGRPAVMVEESLVIFSQNRSGLVKPATGKDCVYGGLVADDDPKPFQMGSHPPASFVQPIHQAFATRGNELVIGGRRLFAKAHQCPADSAAVGP